jgi:hypothetical protein
MTNGGDAHGRTGKKKPGSKKAKGKTPKTPIKGKGLIPPALLEAKDR